jgi:signal transduction histidine kinase
MTDTTPDNEGLTSLLYRFAPRTLRGRLITTTIVVALIVVASTFTIAAALNARIIRIRAEAEAQTRLRGLSDYLVSQAGEIQFSVNTLAARSDIASAVAAGDTAYLARELGESFPPGEGGFETLVLGPDGKALVSLAPTRCAECLTKLQESSGAGLAGPVRMEDGPYLVAAKVMTVDGRKVGTIVADRPLSHAGSQEFPAISGARMVVRDPGTTKRPPGWQNLAVRDFTNASFETRGSEIRTIATLTGIDGKPVVDIALSQFDDSLARTSTIAWISIIASSVFAGIIGLSVGVVIADLVREPVDSMVSRVKKEGYRAIEGMPYSGVSLDNPRLPREFRELGAVVDGLLYGLSARQAELKRVTAATREAEEALAVTVNESVDATILVQDGLIRIANPATTSHLGVAPRNLLGRTPKEVFGSLELTREDGSAVRWDELSLEAADEPLLVRISIAGRGERWLEVRIVQPPSSIKERLLLTARDITDSRRLEQLRSELISMISHDLRSPLTVIVGYLDMLSTDLPEPTREKAIRSARSSAVRMESMLEDLLSAARAEELFAPKVLLPVPLCALAEDVAGSMQATAPEHTIVVACREDQIALGEEKRLRQALVNLVTNAIKYAPAGTEITVAVEGGRDERRAAVVVEDQGRGIPDEYKRKVFDRFTRVDAATAGKPGLGLGLYIVRVIAEGHGGRVYVEDRDGGGARFVIELPATERVGSSAPRSG